MSAHSGRRAQSSHGIAPLRVGSFCPARGPKAMRYVTAAGRQHLDQPRDAVRRRRRFALRLSRLPDRTAGRADALPALDAPLRLRHRGRRPPDLDAKPTDDRVRAAAAAPDAAPAGAAAAVPGWSQMPRSRFLRIVPSRAWRTLPCGAWPSRLANDTKESARKLPLAITRLQ